MDQLDYDILDCLKENGREKASVISEKVNLSVSAVTERIRKLEQQGVIRGYTALTDKKQLGMVMIAIMEISLEHPKFYDGFTKLVAETEEIASCYYLTGDFDFVLKIYASDSEHLEEIHRKIKSIKGVGNTRTHITLKTVKEER